MAEYSVNEIVLKKYIVDTLLGIGRERDFYIKVANSKYETQVVDQKPKAGYYGYIETDTNSYIITKFRFNQNYDLTSDCDYFTEEDYKKAKEYILSGKASITTEINYNDNRIYIIPLTSFSYNLELSLANDAADDDISKTDITGTGKIDDIRAEIASLESRITDMETEITGFKGSISLIKAALSDTAVNSAFSSI